MKLNGNELRTLVIDNRWTASRLSQAQLGSGEDYRELTKLYKNALDALTEWAGKDYAHTSSKADVDNAFTHIKAILEIFATDDNRIIIDQSSMRTMRDCATKPKRLYSEAYTKAMKAKRNADKTVNERLADLETLKVPMAEENETIEDWVARIRKDNINTKSGSVDMLEMFITALGVATVKAQAVEDVKAKGNYTWKRPVAVSLNEFADLIENYVGDCLEDGYNLKSSKVVREEAKARREEAKKAKEAEEKANA